VTTRPTNHAPAALALAASAALGAGDYNTSLTFQPEDPAPTAAPPVAGAEADAAALAEKLSNPVANLISVPLQFNYDQGYGSNDAGRTTLNVQPVIPVSLNEDWTLIIRTILPIIYRDGPEPGPGAAGQEAFGLGDTLQSFFLSPKEPIGGWIIGAGPALNWPTATDDVLGSEKWGAGPTIVALRQDHGFTYGVLANHIWSYAGDDDRDDVSATFVQPFISYTFPSALSLTLNSETSYNWEDDEWTVPFNFVVGQVVKLGGQPVQFSLGARWYAESPDGGPEWGLRFIVTFLFPE